MLLEQVFEDSTLGSFVGWGRVPFLPWPGPEAFTSHGLAAQEKEAR